MINNINDSDVDAKVIQNFALPNKRMMFKMQRSCVGVTHKEKLWIYSHDYMTALDDVKVAKLIAE